MGGVRPEDDLESLKSNPACLRIYGSYLKLKSIGGGKYQGLCPFHSERTPSFTIHADLLFHCYGCGKSGNVIQFVAEQDSIPFQEAVEKVKKEIGPSTWEQNRQKVDSVFKSVVERKEPLRTIALTSWAALEKALEGSSEAVKYLQEQRGISLATAKKLHVGFKQSIGKLAGEQGADIANGGWLAFASIDGDQIVSVKYRSIIRKKPGGFARQSGMATAMWGEESIDPFDPVMLVEGELDRCALEQAGFRAVSVPSAGVKLTPEQKDKLMQASFVVLAGDMDETGSGYMSRLWRELDRAYLLKWPNAKDANEFFLKQCKGDVSIFRTKVEELTSLAKSQPMPDVFSIQEVMVNGEDKSLSERPDRLRLPWSSVDQMAVLLPGSVLGVMATASGTGKTAFTLQASLFGARKYNEVVVNWQCELSPSEIAVMVAAQILRKNRNFLNKEDLKTAAGELDGVQYYVGANSSTNSIDEVLDLLEAAVKRLGGTVVVLDNIHFYVSGVDDEVRVLAAAMKRLKQMAVQYGLKVIVVFQPRKANQQLRGKRTQLSDVKGSATAGDTCDAVFAIHRELAKDEGDEGKKDVYEEKTLIEALKTRSKGVGKSSAFLHFFGEFAEFSSLDLSHEEIPD